MTSFNVQIFRAYDVRGVVGTDLVEEVVAAIGEVLCTSESGGPPATAVVGRDCRLHSPDVSRWLCAGMTRAGASVVDVGMGPTPMLYHAAKGRTVAVMVTGSHNPPEYNGLKILRDGQALHGAVIRELGRGVERILGRGGASADRGGRVAQDPDARERYAADLLARSRSTFGELKVVVDGGNGAAGDLAAEVFRRFGCVVSELYCEPDGRFPNHHPDPSQPENMEELQRRVVAEGADVGFAFDGDGDRLGVVDDRGRISAADRFGALLARRVLAERPGATVLGEVKCSDTFFDDVRAHGGEAVMGPVGHSLVKAAMKERNAAFATELSGHLFFADRWFGFDDALYAGCRVLELIGELKARGERLADALDRLPVTAATPEIRVDCPDDVKFRVVERVRERLIEEVGESGDVCVIDGIRLRRDDSWGLVRASNTQPALVLRTEGRDESSRDAMLSHLQRLIEEARAAEATRGD